MVVMDGFWLWPKVVYGVVKRWRLVGSCVPVYTLASFRRKPESRTFMPRRRAALDPAFPSTLLRSFAGLSFSPAKLVRAKQGQRDDVME
jgi:hypothetical protein